MAHYGEGNKDPRTIPSGRTIPSLSSQRNEEYRLKPWLVGDVKPSEK